MRAFIFDFDGVIVDSEVHWDKHSFSTYKEIIPDFTEEFDKQLKGRNTHDIYDMLIRDFDFSMSKEEYMAHINKLTDEIYGKWSKLLPGLMELLDLLKKRSVPVGIASSGERMWIEPTLKRLGMEGVFDPIVTAKDVGIGKPDPAVYLETARQMGHNPADCVALEDSTNGVKSAKAAGMICIGLHHPGVGYAQDLSLADVQVNGLSEIDEEMLQKMGL